MRTLTILGLFLLTLFPSVNAQTSEKTSELTPYSEWLEKKIEQYKNTNVIFIVKKPFSKKIKDFFVKRRIFGDKSETLKFSEKLKNKTLENGERVVSIIVETSDKDVAFEDVGGKPTARIRYFGRIISKKKNFDRVFEDFLVLTSDLERLLNMTDTTEKKTRFQKSFNLPKGKYSFSLIVTDWVAGIRGTRKFKLEIK